MTDDLLQPSVTRESEERRPPWRLQSQFWVAFLGGALACATIAIGNAGRLGVPRKQRWLMAGLTALTLAILFALWIQQPPARGFMELSRSGNMRLYSRIAAIALYLAFAAIQRKADARYQVFTGGKYESLWTEGAAAVVVMGTLQTLLVIGGAWLARGLR